MDWIVTALALVIAAAIGWWFFRYVRSVSRGNYRHAEGSKSITTNPGAGGHGAGQAPPIVPPSDPDDRIR